VEVKVYSYGLLAGPRDRPVTVEFRSPDGKLRYTASLSALLTPSLHLSGDGEKRAPKFGDYVVRGQVRSERGSPIEGAAILLGDRTVFSNGAGEFVLRLNKPQQMALTVLTEEFLSPLHFAVVSAPSTVTAARMHRCPDRSASLQITCDSGGEPAPKKDRDDCAYAQRIWLA
jgi:hypothetical protein